MGSNRDRTRLIATESELAAMEAKGSSSAESDEVGTKPPPPPSIKPVGRCAWLRHAQSEANRLGPGNVGRDPRLSDQGIEQARQLRGEFNVVVVSPLRRARETLRFSRIKYGELIESALCREVLGGSYPDYLEHEDPESLFETLRKCHQRYQALVKMCQSYTTKGQSVLVITHHCFVALSVGKLLNNAQGFDHPLDLDWVDDYDILRNVQRMATNAIQRRQQARRAIVEQEVDEDSSEVEQVQAVAELQDSSVNGSVNS